VKSIKQKLKSIYDIAHSFGEPEWKDEIYLFNVINSKLMLNNEYSIVDFNKQKLEELNLKNEYLLLIHCLKKKKKTRAYTFILHV